MADPLLRRFAWLAAWRRLGARQPRRPRAGQARWRRDVLAQDGFVCTRCGATDQLEAHHVEPWSRVPGLRRDVANGRTLCAACHQDAHHPRPTREENDTR